jgi:hypothetical protein
LEGVSVLLSEGTAEAEFDAVADTEPESEPLALPLLESTSVPEISAVRLAEALPDTVTHTDALKLLVSELEPQRDSVTVTERDNEVVGVNVTRGDALTLPHWVAVPEALATLRDCEPETVRDADTVPVWECDAVGE